LTPALRTISFLRFHVFHQLSPANDLNPKSDDGATFIEAGRRGAEVL
jgi:hypothetical protein